jgi:protease-4
MKDLFLSLFGIFKFTGRLLTAIRNTVFNLLLLVIIVVAVASLFVDRSPKLLDNSILVLSLAGDIVEEKKPISTFARLFEEIDDEQSKDQEILLQDIVHLIDRAAADQRITAILLDMKYMGSAGLDQLQVIGSALKRFSKTGRQVIAAEDLYTQKQYYLASYADLVAINPMGGVDLHGFGAYSLYFREALEKLRVNFHVFRVGTYKSAVEPIIRDSMSPEARQQNSLWLTSLWDSYVTDIISEREIGRPNIDAYTTNIDSLLAQTGGDTAKLALNMGLVDKIWTRSQVQAHLASIAGTSSERDYTWISSTDFLKMIGPAGVDDGSSPNKIGILIAQGNILPGKQPTGVIGGDTLAELIREARKEESVKAVVLRISSGGGSAFASEIIRQELLELKKSGKPLVVSMGTVAASGGYWIAADADEIWAAPTTITGSIGIFGAIPTFENSLAEIGVRSDGVGTTPLAAGLDLTQPLNPQLKQSIQLSVDHGYRQFLGIVEKGRKIDRQQLDSIAEGRVFDGRTAQKIGLVDRLGDLEQAIAAAASLAKVTGDYDPVYIQRSHSFVEQVMEKVAAEQAALTRLSAATHPLLADFRRLLDSAVKQLPLFSDPRGVYAQCFVTGRL